MGAGRVSGLDLTRLASVVGLWRMVFSSKHLLARIAILNGALPCQAARFLLLATAGCHVLPRHIWVTSLRFASGIDEA